jgi:hypothetical protein
MPIPYLLTTLLYAFMALLVAADAALVSLGLASPFTALRWERVHFITLGIISQAVFGLLPGLVPFPSRRPSALGVWLALNVG